MILHPCSKDTAHLNQWAPSNVDLDVYTVLLKTQYIKNEQEKQIKKEEKEAEERIKERKRKYLDAKSCKVYLAYLEVTDFSWRAQDKFTGRGCSIIQLVVEIFHAIQCRWATSCPVFLELARKNNIQLGS